MTSETECCDNVVTTLSDVATKIQPKPNVATTSCARFSLILPYKGKKGEHTLNIKHHITKYLSEHQVVTLVFTGTKLDHKINIKDKTRKEQQHDLTYSVVCPDANYNEEHIHKLSG